MTTRIERSALVGFSARQMYELVRDVPAYPGFLSWCSNAAVEEESNDSQQVASLEISLAGLKQRFTTRNSLSPPSRIDIELVSGPFRQLEGRWTFEPVGESGCCVTLTLTFAVASRLLSGALEKGFARVADRLVDDFCRRAEQVYGE